MKRGLSFEQLSDGSSRQNEVNRDNVLKFETITPTGVVLRQFRSFRKNIADSPDRTTDDVGEERSNDFSKPSCLIVEPISLKREIKY